MSTVTLENVGWKTYQQLLSEIGEQARLTYDRGCLEIEMSPLLKHEAPNRLLETLIGLFCEEREIPFLLLGSTTLSRESQRQGAEPDSALVLGERAEIQEDYTNQEASALPPDLVIEVDITSPSVGKDSLYHSLGVREIWRWRDASLSILQRGESGFAAISKSELLPGASATDVTNLILRGQRTTQILWRREVRAWARGDN